MEDPDARRDRASEPAAPPAARRRGLAAAQVLVSLAAVGGVAWWASTQDVPRLPSAGEAVGPLLGALAVYAVATVLRGERWRRILRGGGVAAGRRDAYALTTVGYMGNNALPARAGDVLKAWLSAREADASRRDAFGALLAERLLDAVALVVLFAVLVGVAGLPLGLSRGIVALLAGAVIAVAAGVALAGRRRAGSAHRLWVLLHALLDPTRRLLGSRAGLELLGVSLAIWLAEGAVYAIVGTVAGVHLGLANGLYVMALANLAAMVPAAPGYVGTFDAAVLLGVRLTVGAAAGAALPYVVLVRFVLFVPITVVGLFFLLARYGGLRTLRLARA